MSGSERRGTVTRLSCTGRLHIHRPPREIVVLISEGNADPLLPSLRPLEPRATSPLPRRYATAARSCPEVTRIGERRGISRSICDKQIRRPQFSLSHLYLIQGERAATAACCARGAAPRLGL